MQIRRVEAVLKGNEPNIDVEGWERIVEGAIRDIP